LAAAFAAPASPAGRAARSPGAAVDERAPTLPWPEGRSRTLVDVWLLRTLVRVVTPLSTATPGRRFLTTTALEDWSVW
jgi:hypothetical protein